MAQKRMFDKAIVDSDRFYSLPIESQLLYFHLGMHADVKGFVEPLKISRLCGIKIEALTPLAQCKLIIPFHTGVVVITDWNINNQVREGREAPSRFIHEQSLITLTDNGIYQLRDNSGSTPAQNRIEENRIEENNINITAKTQNNPENPVGNLGIQDSNTNVEAEASQPPKEEEYGNKDINRLIKGFDKYLPNKIPHDRRLTATMLKLFQKSGVKGVKKGREWQDDEWTTNVINFIDWEEKNYGEKAAPHSSKTLYQHVKRWLANEGKNLTNPIF